MPRLRTSTSPSTPPLLPNPSLFRPPPARTPRRLAPPYPAATTGMVPAVPSPSLVWFASLFNYYTVCLLRMHTACVLSRTGNGWSGPRPGGHDTTLYTRARLLL